MAQWDAYPTEYRAETAGRIVAAVAAGESVSLVGLSGAGKSNLLRALAARPPGGGVHFVLVDGNRLAEATPAGFLELMRRSLPAAPREPAPDPLEALTQAVAAHLEAAPGLLGWLLDLSLLVGRDGRLFGPGDRLLFNNLRALRDTYKYRLAYVAATRHPLPKDTEISELFFGHTLWLGPLSAADARWSAGAFAARRGLAWDTATLDAITAVSGGYPALLRAVCEAHAGGAPLDVEALASHPAVAARLDEFWADSPAAAELDAAGLTGLALLTSRRPAQVEAASLTAKEHRLLEYLAAHAGEVCTKDDLIRAVWPEDRVFAEGVRDDSLAQLVRRLREKIEPQASRPRYVLTVPGRGYRYVPDPRSGG